MKSSAAVIQGIINILYVSFELCTKGNWKLAFTTGMGQKPRMRNVAPGNTDAVRAEIARAKKRFGLPDNCRVISCYEAGRDGFWLHRFLESEGVENLVVDSSSIEVNRRKRRTKTDRLDAAKLVTMLIRWAEGEKTVWSVVHVPSDEAEDDRHLERELAALKADRTRIVNRIKSLLATQGVKVKAIDESFKSQLKEMRCWDGTPLRMGLINRVLLEYERLLLARAQISAIEKERRRLLKESESPASQAAWKLSQLKAIGMNGSWVYATEMFGWRKFNNRKEVGSVTGLTGTHYRSGTEWRELGIDKAGNKRVRGIAVEIAWCWVRYQPKSDLTLWFQERFGAGGKRLRKIGIVALARKLTIALWRWVDQDVLPEGAVLK